MISNAALETGKVKKMNSLLLLRKKPQNCQAVSKYDQEIREGTQKTKLNKRGNITK